MSMAMKSPIEMDRTELKAGDTLPNYVLTAEDGKLIRVSDFRGKAVAFTFFFTRCPLPDYCPRMNTDFAQTRSLLLKDASAPTNWQIISISFDPEFDTPEVLSRYARAYRGDDPSRWIFATGTTNALADAALHLDLMVMRQGGSITHNLRTVVLDAEGRIYQQFDGNEWTPQQLADAINQAARQPTR
jgi:protein SCO1/2